MAISEKQKQKKLQKKKKKQKFRKSSSGTAVQSGGKASKYAMFPFHECLVPDGLFELGVGNVIVARRVPNGSIAISSFIVDVFCLGVKNTLFKVTSQYEYEHTVKPRVAATHEQQNMESISPACARKLVEGAVHYAKELGFSPHRDYKDAKEIFGDVDSSECPVEYTYGMNGKPYYVRGPNESIPQAKRIVDQLKKRCGPGNYEYTIMLDEGMSP